MEGFDCARDVLDRLTAKCDSVGDSTKTTISIAYVLCRLGKDKIDVPYVCKYTIPMTSCKQAMFKIPSMWSTYNGFYRNIDAVCFAHTFDQKQRDIERGVADLLKTGDDITTGIAKLVNQLFDFQLKTMPYLQSIENGVQNTFDAVSSLTAIVSKLYNLTERVADRVDVILVGLNDVTDRVGDLSHDVSTMGSVIENSSVTIDRMSGKLDGFEGKFEKFFDFLELCRPFMAFFDKTFMILCSPFYLPLSFCAVWVWWYHFHGPPAKLISIIVPCAFYQISLDVFTRTPPYLLVVGCIALMLVIAVVYCALDFFYTRGRFRGAERVLEKFCQEYEKKYVYN
jgi:hypothetical protein